MHQPRAPPDAGMSFSSRRKSRELGDLNSVFGVKTLVGVTAIAAEMVFDEDGAHSA
jgi:hypothetical protein